MFLFLLVEEGILFENTASSKSITGAVSSSSFPISFLLSSENIS